MVVTLAEQEETIVGAVLSYLFGSGQQKWSENWFPSNPLG